MYGSFRFLPPEPRPDLVARPRLLRHLVKRWEHRITSVLGGPGLGKTTLLAQTVAENRLAPRGEDVWIGLEAHDADADRLANVVATALTRDQDDRGDSGASDRPVPHPGTVADVLWRRSPSETCLLLDDVQHVPPGSTGATWLNDLLDSLPTNGHIVLAGRSEPPVSLARYGAQGALLLLAEDDLKFSDDELNGFATQRGLDPRHFEDTAGWPAMAALVANVDRRVTGDYLWNEVLEPLGTLRRHTLAVLSDLGGADDELLSAALGGPVELARTLDGVPLVASQADGWYVPHKLWSTAPGLALDQTERKTIRRRAAENLAKRARFDEAFRLAHDVGLTDAAEAVLRAACVKDDQIEAGQLGQWLATSSDAVRDSLAGRLAGSVHTALTAPEQASEPLQAAAAESRAAGDREAELTALIQLAVLAWWRQDQNMFAEMTPRLVELEATGHPKARGIVTIMRALMADLVGDHATAGNEFARLESMPLDPTWRAYAGYLWTTARIDDGQPEAGCEIVERFAGATARGHRYLLDAARLQAWWAMGRVDDVLAEIPVAVDRAKTTGQKSTTYHGLAITSMVYSYLGDTTAAARYLDDVVAWAPPSPEGLASVSTAVATASLQVAEGNEADAVNVLQQAVAAYGVDLGLTRRAWRQGLCLTYVLVPDTRAHWDSTPLHGHLHAARELATAVVESRERRPDSRLRTVNVPEPDVVRAVLHHRFAAELAVGLTDVGRPDGRALLDALGSPGRDAVHHMTHGQTPRARPAKALLTAVPAPPPRSLHVAVLGPLVLRADGPDGDEINHPDLRRSRVQTLLAYLIGNRRTTRAAICDAFWPDLDERSAANNLNVTVNHLLRLLEPWREPGEPAYLLRVDGQTVQLATGDHLRIDIDDFDRHVAAASRAEADGLLSVALDHHLAAVDLYRGSLHADLPDGEPWLALDREHYRTRLVASATRAGQLLLGRGDTEAAQTIAHRALGIDPWSEDAYTILVRSTLARGDRSGAHRLFKRCLDALGDLGVTPSPATQQLQHRLQGADA